MRKASPILNVYDIESDTTDSDSTNSDLDTESDNVDDLGYDVVEGRPPTPTPEDTPNVQEDHSHEEPGISDHNIFNNVGITPTEMHTDNQTHATVPKAEALVYLGNDGEDDDIFLLKSDKISKNELLTYSTVPVDDVNSIKHKLDVSEPESSIEMETDRTTKENEERIITQDFDETLTIEPQLDNEIVVDISENISVLQDQLEEKAIDIPNKQEQEENMLTNAMEMETIMKLPPESGESGLSVLAESESPEMTSSGFDVKSQESLQKHELHEIGEINGKNTDKYYDPMDPLNKYVTSIPIDSETCTQSCDHGNSDFEEEGLLWNSKDMVFSTCFYLHQLVASKVKLLMTGSLSSTGHPEQNKIKVTFRFKNKLKHMITITKEIDVTEKKLHVHYLGTYVFQQGYVNITIQGLSNPETSYGKPLQLLLFGEFDKSDVEFLTPPKKVCTGLSGPEARVELNISKIQENPPWERKSRVIGFFTTVTPKQDPVGSSFTIDKPQTFSFGLQNTPTHKRILFKTEINPESEFDRRLTQIIGQGYNVHSVIKRNEIVSWYNLHWDAEQTYALLIISDECNVDPCYTVTSTWWAVHEGSSSYKWNYLSSIRRFGARGFNGTCLSSKNIFTLNADVERQAVFGHPHFISEKNIFYPVHTAQFKLPPDAFKTAKLSSRMDCTVGFDRDSKQMYLRNCGFFEPEEEELKRDSFIVLPLPYFHIIRDIVPVGQGDSLPHKDIIVLNSARTLL